MMNHTSGDWLEAGNEALLNEARHARKAQPFTKLHIHRHASAYRWIGNSFRTLMHSDPAAAEAYHFYGMVAFDCADVYYSMLLGPAKRTL
jgi:hypothetical protein